MSNLDSYFIGLMERYILDIKNGLADVVNLDINLDFNGVLSIKVSIYKRDEK